MNKKNIRVSDAIPEMPLSFDRTVEQTLRRVCGEQKTAQASASPTRWTSDDSASRQKPKKHWLSQILTYSAAAVLLVMILGIGGILLKSTLRSTSKPAAHAPSTSAKVSIRLLPELEDAELCAKAREDAQQPAFSEEDWGWIRKIDVSIESFEYTEDTLQWTTVFRIKPQNRPAQWSENPFETGDTGSLRILEDGTSVFLNGSEEQLSVNTETWTEVDADGSWLVYVGSQAVLSDLPLYDGVAPVRQQFRLIDRAVDDWATSATVAVIEQTFSVDLTLFSTTPQPNGLSPTPQPDMPDALSPAIFYNSTLYRLAENVPEYAGDVDPDAYLGYINSAVSSNRNPTEKGQANFDGIGSPYALTEQGLVVLYNHEWRLFEPMLPDASQGVFDAAYAQVLSEKQAIDAEYRQKDTMTEQQIGALDEKAAFLQQRLVKLLKLWANAVKVDQTDGKMRLDQITYFEGQLFFAFAAPRGMSFDEAPVIKLDRQSLAVWNETEFFGLRETETEHYAIYAIHPSPLQGERMITVENGGAFFCFRYLLAENRVKLPSDAERTQWLIDGNGYLAPNASQEPPIEDVSYYYLVNGVPVYPYENFLYEDKDGLAADGMSIRYQLEDEKVRRAIPKVLYDPDASFGIAVTDGWKLMEFAIFDSRYNRIGTVGHADLKETEPGVYSVPEQLKTLSPGIYYLNAIVAKQDGGASRGNELVIGLNVGGVDDDDLSDRTPQPTPTPVTTIKLTPAPQEEPNPKHIPMICYNDELYGMHDEIRPDAPDADAASGTVTSVVSIGEIPETDGQANFGSTGMRFYVTRDGLVVWYNDEWRLFVAEELGDDPDNVLWNDSNAFPGLFKFWDYDEVIGYREAPAEGVLFVCDFDGDGKEEEIRYQKHGQYLTISLGKKSVEVDFGAGLEQVILLDLDPDSARLNLLVVYNTGSEDYETAELHMENGRFVRGPVIRAYCSFDGNTVRGSATQTDILGTKFGGRTYHGEKLTPDSEWFDCDVIPDEIQSASDRERLIEGGKLLHLVRDLPCTIDGADAMIPAGSYIYMTRWHESGTLAEIRTEDGTTALLTVERADLLDSELYGYLIDGATQDTYFDNIFYAD